MALMSVEELYEKYVKPLPAKERLRLVSLTAEELSRETSGANPQKRDILEFVGVGRHNPIGLDAQEYINQMRDEWDR